MSEYIDNEATTVIVELWKWADSQDLIPRCCCVCHQTGPGMTVLPDGRAAHRWPCKERLL